MIDTARMLACALRALRRPRIDARASSALSLLALPSDIDPFLHVTNSRYLAFMDLGRLDLLVRTGILQAALRLRAPMLVGDLDVQFRRPLLPFQRFTLVSRLVAWDARWFIWEHHFRSGEHDVAQGLARVTFRRRGALISPAEVLVASGQDPQSPSMPENVHTWLQRHPHARQIKSGAQE